jgi:hypothetical protein
MALKQGGTAEVKNLSSLNIEMKGLFFGIKGLGSKSKEE